MRNTRIAMAVATPLVLLLIAPAALAADDFSNVTFDPSDDGSITVTANVYKDMKPDILNLSISCDYSQQAVPRKDLLQKFQQTFTDLKTIVGTDGDVRKTGRTVYAGYIDPSAPGIDQTFTGNASFLVRNFKGDNATAVQDAIETKLPGCTPSWDARVLYVEKAATEDYGELMEQVMSQKAFYEKMINKKLTRMTNASLSGYADSTYYGGGGYGSNSSPYDPETNTLTMNISLSVSFEFAPKKDTTK